MNLQQITQDLKMALQQEDYTPDWQLSDTITQGLLADPDASIRYINGRLNRQFESKFEIGEHIREFQRVSGLTPGLMSQLNLKLNLQTKPTTAALKRQASILETKQTRFEQLNAAIQLIRGLGSMHTLETTTGVNHMTIYKLARKLTKEQGVAYAQLRTLADAERRVLALKAEKAHKAYLDDHFRRQLGL